MKNNIYNKTSLPYFLVLSFLFIFLTSCKKDKPSPEVDPFAIDTSQKYLSNSYENNLRDSIWYYYKVLSLWQDVIPPTSQTEINKIDELGFIRNNYSQYFETGETTLDYLMGLTKNRLPNRTPLDNYDWYSFIDRGGSVSSSIKESLSSGLGMSLFYIQTSNNEDNADLFIQFVEKNSSAYNAGLKRGDQIISINGDTKLDYNYQKNQNFKPLLDFLKLPTITIKTRNTNGEIEEKTLTYTTYSNSPIIVGKTIEDNSKKIGYFLFNSFYSIKNNGFYTSFYRDLEELFSKFERDGITELIIDLRNNGGGDVETAAYLANRVAPASENGKTMYSYEVNNTIKSWGWLDDGEEFAPIKFQKRGNLNLTKVYFLVSPNTASASELLINSLKPVITTYMIGTYSLNDSNIEVADKTYGKPVGFFGLPVVDDNLELYVTSFKMYNRNGEGDYYDGLTPNANVWEYRNFQDFGHPEETMLATALNHIHNGSFTPISLVATNKSRGAQTGYKTKHLLNKNLNNTNSGMFKFKK